MDIPKPTRLCCVSERELMPGEDFYSMLTEEENVLHRSDYAPEHWPSITESSTENLLGWWKTRLPVVADKKTRLAPNEILLNLFAEWRLQPENADMLYVLTLLLIRRRLFRYEREIANGEDGQKILIVYALKENTEFEVVVAMPNPERLREIQEQLSQLLYN